MNGRDPTFGAVLRGQATARGEATALVSGREQLSYAELHATVSAVARGLVGLGLDAHERVAIFLDASAEAAIAIFAAWSAGLIAVPINPKLKAGQVAHIIADCSPRVLITSPWRLRQLAHECDFTNLKVVTTGQSSGPDSLNWSQLAGTSPEARLHRVIDIDPAAILYTSGSTGLPKGVVVSHRNLTAGAQAVNAYLGTTPADTILALLPLSFDAGLSQLTTGFAAGAKVVLHTFLRANDVASLCLAHAVTSMTAVPPLWRLVADAQWSDEARRNLRLFANTGGHMNASLLAELRQLFPEAKPFLMYGLTEAFRSTYLDPAQVDVRPGSIGKAIPNNEILVLHESGRRCAPNEVGELVHRGALVSLGYWNRPEETSARFRPLPNRQTGLTAEIGVWSGDLVMLDSDGYLYFRGRRDEMIKTSGYRVSPQEVESALAEAPGLVESAVFGIEDEALGQSVVAAIVLDRDADIDAIGVFAAARLPNYMQPRFWVLDALPRSPNGKIDRPALRARHHSKQSTTSSGAMT